MDPIKYYIAFHQKGNILSGDKMYKALQVGKETSGFNIENIQNDAIGENISAKNGIYSELTGWYWIWKNQKHDYIGTGHYRRYFTTQKSFVREIGKLLLYFIGLKNKRHGLYYVRSSIWEKRILTAYQTEELMKTYEAILPLKKKFKYTVYEQYKRRHNENDIILTRNIIQEKYPDYIKAFDETFKSRKMYSFNMFVMPWKTFDEYMNWLFPILFELEKKSEIDFNDKYQKRVCAFMAERLQTVWFNKNKLKTIELPVLYFKKMKNPII